MHASASLCSPLMLCSWGREQDREQTKQKQDHKQPGKPSQPTSVLRKIPHLLHDDLLKLTLFQRKTTGSWKN